MPARAVYPVWRRESSYKMMSAQSLLLLCLVCACAAIPQYSGDQSAFDVPFIPEQSTLCDTGFGCVPWQRCVDGYIVTSAISGTDQRTQPTNYNDLQCGDVGNMCCHIPPEHVIAAIDACGHASYSCVPYFQCGSDGKIVTDGAGLIDVRITPQGVCTNPEYPDVPAVCCLKPDALGPTLAPIIDACHAYQECVAFELCSASGHVVTDGSGLIDIRTGYMSCYLESGIGGRCCTPPPPRSASCPAGSVCTLGNKCTGDALDALGQFIEYSSSGSWSLCSYETGDGVCCINKRPPHVDVCPGDSFCTSSFECFGKALDGSNNFVDYVSTSIWSTCSHGGGDGVCCLNPPPYVDICPENSVCTLAPECDGRALNGAFEFVNYLTTGQWTECLYTSGNGICCISSSKYVDACPYPSVCLPKAKCVGHAWHLQKFNRFPDTKISDWTACNQNGGICCVNPALGCGVRNNQLTPRIASRYSNESLFGEFPWQAVIFDKQNTFICGAVLISAIHVLTGAHCIDDYTPTEIQIRFGEWKVNAFDEPLAYIDRNVASYNIHERFNPKNLQNDVALIQLSEPVPLLYHINTVCLPKPGDYFPPNAECYATGWGKDAFVGGKFQHTLKKIDLPFVDQATCQALLRKTRLGSYFTLDSSFACAGGEENKDACYGDGGGPLVCYDPSSKRYSLVGLTAWGIGCGTKDIPGVYVNVQYFHDWIDALVHSNQLTEVPAGYGK